MRVFTSVVTVKEQVEMEQAITAIFSEVVRAFEACASEGKKNEVVSFTFLYVGSGKSTEQSVREKIGKQDPTNPAVDFIKTTFPEGFKPEEVVAYLYERVVQLLVVFQGIKKQNLIRSSSEECAMTFIWKKNN